MIFIEGLALVPLRCRRPLETRAADARSKRSVWGRDEPERPRQWHVGPDRAGTPATLRLELEAPRGIALRRRCEVHCRKVEYVWRLKAGDQKAESPRPIELEFAAARKRDRAASRRRAGLQLQCAAADGRSAGGAAGENQLITAGVDG